MLFCVVYAQKEEFGLIFGAAVAALFIFREKEKGAHLRALLYCSFVLPYEGNGLTENRDGFHLLQWDDFREQASVGVANLP